VDTRPDPSRPVGDPGDVCPSILVAVNGGASGWQALDWAAAECAVRGARLSIVHVVNDISPMFDPLGACAYAWFSEADRERGARVLDEAARRARLVAPDVRITTRLEVGPTAAGVRNADRKDPLIVVGRGRTRPLGFGSTDSRIARRARGPVAVVELDPERRGGPSGGRVVLGIDEEAAPQPALVYAFRAASRRGVGLTIIRAGAGEPDGARRPDSRQLAIDDAVTEYGHAFQDVDVRCRFVGDAAGSALVAESSGAALLVFGARSPSRLRCARLSSLARCVLRWACSSVVIIRTPHSASPARAAERRGPGFATLGATDA
jgi:nucleotide-binding universal stress UspA family protein